MALFNYATKEITLKIVYYGPGLSGKTTNLQYLHSVLNTDTKGKLLSLSTESDRTLFFDFLPVELGKIRDFSIRFQLYTVPGQIRYNATRKVVLKGADAVVFVADSQREMREQNIESFLNMKENLLSNNINPDEIPIILQYNKRDLKNTSSIEEMNATLNSQNYDFVEAVAIKGTGVEDSFRLITKLIIRQIAKKHKIEIQPARSKEEAMRPEANTEISKFEPEISVPEPIILEKPAAIPEPIPEIGLTKKAVIKEPGLFESAPKNEMMPEASKIMDNDKISDMTAVLEKIELISGEIRKINVILSDLQASFTIIGRGASELPAIKKGQEETKSILRDITNTIEGLKPKKGWFKF
jgi:hypothetical protein